MNLQVLESVVQTKFEIQSLIVNQSENRKLLLLRA